ncbi:XRE family transcriptional regulator [Aliidiomarina iranensis]|uniref:XRE family transcriptional regulator n=1 Tax=Aliidiomarina iranensis TaxID=1434071 RepID=A0A432W1K1_9GAMM|nr:helix-turn-helix transcriptional regulator [Aliidiomarina iranensis]RUO23099.1 XRE family transcriptional regulator [Aliidiomarina iranensis]
MNIDASKIREARLAKGWTQQQLGDVSALSLRTIQRIESQGQGSLETCNALCAVLELERTEVLQKTANANSDKRVMPIRLIGGALIVGFFAGVVFTLLFSFLT